jgi:peptide deformylase
LTVNDNEASNAPQDLDAAGKQAENSEKNPPASLVFYPDAMLRQKCVSVGIPQEEHLAAASQLKATAESIGAVGLAANQAGIPFRIAVIRGANGEYAAFFDPEIVECGETMGMKEGCISLPGVLARTKRALSVTIEAADESGVRGRFKAVGQEAQTWQHEVDHLDGKLMTDSVDLAFKAGVDAKLKQLARAAKAKRPVRSGNKRKKRHGAKKKR